MTGSGESACERASAGDEVTVVPTTPAETGAVTLLSMLQVLLLITVPLVRGLATRTVIWPDPEAPAARIPRRQVTSPLARVPPPVDETKLVLAGTPSDRMTFVAS